MGYEIKPSMYNLHVGGRILSRLLYPNTYRVAQKSKPLPNDQKIVLNLIKVCQWN